MPAAIYEGTRRQRHAQVNEEDVSLDIQLLLKRNKLTMLKGALLGTLRTLNLHGES